MITNTGEGLNIDLLCNYKSVDNWQTFVSWYSIYKNLPDAKIKISCFKSPITPNIGLFKWPAKVKVPFKYNSFVEKEKTENDIVINCDTLAVRDFNGFTISDAKSNDITTFVSISKGWGNFVLSEWIDREDAPFSRTKHYINGSMSINEKRIAELWKKANDIYAAIGR